MTSAAPVVSQVTQWLIVTDTMCQGTIASPDDIFATQQIGQAEFDELSEDLADAEMDNDFYLVEARHVTGDQWETVDGVAVTITSSD